MAEEQPVAYNVSKYPRPSVTVDLVIFTIQKRDLRVLLVQRGAVALRGHVGAARRLRPHRRVAARDGARASWPRRPGWPARTSTWNNSTPSATRTATRAPA